jgi:hypothetical protein
MHHRVNLVRGKGLFDLRAIRKVGLYEGSRRGYGATMPFLQVIQRNHLVTPR